MASKYLDDIGLAYLWGKIKGWVNSSSANVVHRTGDETVEGVKVFSNAHATDPVSSPDLRASSIIIKSPDLVRGVLPEYKRHLNLQLVDSTGTDVGQTGRLGSMEYEAPMQGGDGRYGVYIRSWKFLPADDPHPSTGTALFVGYDKDEIPYSTAPVTSDDRTDSADIVTRGFMEASEWNWQKTKKAVAVTFKPVPESDLESVVDFMYTETLPAEGEKGPSNPSTIAGVSSAVLTRCGKNLCPIDKIATENATGLTINANTSDGYISISGTASSSASIYLRTKAGKNNILLSNSISRGKTYTFSLSSDAPSGVALKLFVKSTEASAWVARVNVGSGNSQTYTIPAITYSAMLRIDVSSGTSLNCKCYAQVEEGATSTPFEPYEETDYTIQLGDTYYGGSLDVTTGVMTVTHRYIVLNGTENFSLVNYGTYYQYRLNIADYAALSGDALAPVVTTEKCTHFEIRNTTNLSYAHVIAYGVRLDFFASQQTVDSFKSWLASEYAAEHPVSIVYPLAIPLTVQLTPTQIRSLPAIDKYEPRINTVYTDQEAVQVGYQRYANYVDLTTNQTIDGEKIFRRYIRVKTTSFSSAGYSLLPYDTYASRADALDALAVFDDNYKRLFLTRTIDKDSNGNRFTNIYTVQPTGLLSRSPCLAIGLLDVDGAAIGFAQAPSTPEYEADGTTKRTAGGDIVTRDWIPKDTRIVHTTGNETIGGRKRFSDVTVFGSTSNAYEQLVIASVTNGVRVAAENFGTSSRGAGLQLSGRSSPTDAGQFTIFATNATSDKNLIGKPDGTLTWNGQSIQTSSDERIKTSLSEVPDVVLDAWEDVNWGQFQYLDAVKEKGESARLHLGLIAQHVMSVFEKHGLDACAYGILCHEEREATEEDPAVDLWMVRYAEAQAMEACCMRRENARLKKRVADLEERLEALELLLKS